MSLRVDVKDAGEGKLLEVEGEVDMDSAPALRDALMKTIRGSPLLRVDLSRVSYLDSSGIAVLIEGYKASQEAGTAFRLLNPSPQVRAVIELAQLNQLFAIETSETI